MSAHLPGQLEGQGSSPHLCRLQKHIYPESTAAFWLQLAVKAECDPSLWACTPNAGVREDTWFAQSVYRLPPYLRASSASSLSRSCRSLSLLISFSSWRYFRSMKRFWCAIWGKLSGTGTQNKSAAEAFGENKPERPKSPGQEKYTGKKNTARLLDGKLIRINLIRTCTHTLPVLEMTLKYSSLICSRFRNHWFIWAL